MPRTKSRKYHQLDVLHICALLQMRDQLPEGIRLRGDPLRVLHRTDDHRRSGYSRSYSEYADDELPMITARLGPTFPNSSDEV